VIYTHLAAALIAAAVAATGAWKVQDWRYGAKEADRQARLAKEQIRRADRIDTAASDHERDKAEIRIEYETITKEVERVVEKPIYRDMCLDADGLRVLSDAIHGADPAGEPAGTVPRPATAPGR
jgi:hypothetical protein